MFKKADENSEVIRHPVYINIMLYCTIQDNNNVRFLIFFFKIDRCGGIKEDTMNTPPCL